MVSMCTLNAKRHGWFDQVLLAVWGPSSPVRTIDDELQEQDAQLKLEGIEKNRSLRC